jgi:hypothetical protein
MALGVTLVGCSDEDTVDGPYAGYDSELYRDTASWLCHPDQAPGDNLCNSDLDTSVVAPDGTVTMEEHVSAEEPAVDCFYVYPTVSSDSTVHSDLEVDEEEPFIVVNQAARLGSVCRVYAPIYRQLTVAGLLGAEDFDALDWASPYADVVDAFKHYIANDNQGRGFILVGHSQGSRHLSQLVQEEIETIPELADRMIAAYLIGWTTRVPAGEDVGGDFAITPLCRSADQTGCLVTYSTYRDTEPPVSETSVFGETGDASTEAGCTSPATLVGNDQMSSYFPTEVEGLFASFVSGSPFADPDMHDPIATPFYAVPGLVTGGCVDEDGHQYVKVTVHGDPDDPRTDDIDGDFTEGWGLHLIDVHLMMGDLVELAHRQSEAWLAR